MGAVVLYLILVMDGNEVLTQERFENMSMCEIHCNSEKL